MKYSISVILLGLSLFTSNLFASSAPNLTIRLLGSATGYENMVPDIDGDGNDDLATCFDADIYDVSTNLKIGTGTDCLSNITPVDNGLSVIATTYFNLPAGNIVVRGQTSVQPKTGGSPDITHITGSIPTATTSNVISGSGAFKKASGQSRLSGAVNLSRADSDGIIYFDCLFIINLD